jgi:cytochrome c553
LTFDVSFIEGKTLKLSFLNPFPSLIRYTRIEEIFVVTRYLVTMKKLLIVAVAAMTLAGTVNAQGVKGDVKAAESKVAMCIGCHAIPGYRSSFPEIYTVPMIGGQNAEYIVAALQAYKKGERKHPTMRGIAGSLTDQDMADLAVYYAAQSSATTINKLK